MLSDHDVLREETRAVECVESLIRLHAGSISPELRSLVESEGGTHARATMLRLFGYVPSEPEAWARSRVERDRFPTGLPGCAAPTAVYAGADDGGTVTCARCTFVGPRTEFVSIGLGPDGLVVLQHRDEAGPQSVLICVGCGSSLGRVDPGLVRVFVLDMLESAVS